MSSDYFRQKQCSCLGIGIYYVDNDYFEKNVIADSSSENEMEMDTEEDLSTYQNVVKCIRVNIFSDSLEQSAESTLRAFKFLRNQDFYKKIEKDKKKIHMFSDVGTHFRNKTLTHYFFRDLAEEGLS